jgi:hypothetical protein
MDPRLVVQRSRLHSDNTGGQHELRQDRRTARAAETTAYIYRVTALPPLLVRRQHTRHVQLRFVNHKVDRKRTAPLTLTVITVTQGGSDQLSGDLITHLTTQTPSGQRHRQTIPRERSPRSAPPTSCALDLGRPSPLAFGVHSHDAVIAGGAIAARATSLPRWFFGAATRVRHASSPECGDRGCHGPRCISWSTSPSGHTV